MADQFNPQGWPIRLSPSGPFIRDPDSGGNLEIGPGSTGIIIRAQGTSGTPITAPSGGAANILGLANVPVHMPKGFHYDIKAILEIIGPDLETTPNDTFEARVEYSDDNGGSWQEFPSAGSPSGVPRMYGVAETKGAGTLVFEEIDVDCTDPTEFPNDITNLRLQVTSASGAIVVNCGLTTIRVEQYVPAPVPA